MSEGFKTCDTCGRVSSVYDTENSVYRAIDPYDDKEEEVVRCERCRELNKHRSSSSVNRAEAS